MAFEKADVYHSSLVKEGTITVVITSDVTPSKFKDKPPFVAFKFNGKEHRYATENEDCERALEGLKGKRVELTANGNREEASIDIHIVGDAPSDNRGSNRNSGQQQRGNDRQQSRNEPREQPRQQQPQGNGPVFGATVGMAINNACSLIREGSDADGYFDYLVSPAFSKDLFLIASDIIRVSRMLEAGQLAKPVKDRMAAHQQQPTEAARQPERAQAPTQRSQEPEYDSRPKMRHDDPALDTDGDSIPF